MHEEAFTCPACSAEFTVRERLDEEQEQVQGEEREVHAMSSDDEPVTCPDCGAEVTPWR